MRKVVALISALALATSISPAHAAPAAPTEETR